MRSATQATVGFRAVFIIFAGMGTRVTSIAPTERTTNVDLRNDDHVPPTSRCLADIGRWGWSPDRILSAIPFQFELVGRVGLFVPKATNKRLGRAYYISSL